MGQTWVVSVYTVGDELVKYVLALTFLSLSTDPFLRQERSLKATMSGHFGAHRRRGAGSQAKVQVFCRILTASVHALP